jgi:Cu-Zn family superoxide dismutase
VVKIYKQLIYIQMCSSAIAIFENASVQGRVRFHECAYTKATVIDFDLYGIEPNMMCACHIHEYGDESDGCKSLGSHWNPTGSNHGYTCLSIGENKPKKYSGSVSSHAGDLLNNIQADKHGKFSYIYKDPRVRLKGDISESIVGRSVVIHYGIDDLGLGGDSESLKTGNAGGRMACSIIGHSKS